MGGTSGVRASLDRRRIARSGALAVVLAMWLGLEAASAARDDTGRASPAEPGSTRPARPLPDSEAPPVVSPLGPTGIELESSDGRHRLHLWFRGQFRFSTPFDNNPRTPADFSSPTVHSFDVNRARIKVKGNAYQTWLKYYFEYDFVGSNLLDLHLTIARFSWLQLRVGQWKVTYNRERVDSSGKQQFVERSIVNREFTVDRQPGVMLGSHLGTGRPFLDSWLFFGLFNGNGRGASNDDSHPMWMGRYQWAFLGRQLAFSQCDVNIHEEPAATLSLAAVGNRSPYTRFSTEGGGQLDGFEPGEAGRYDLRQYLAEFALKYRGLSIQQELHWKEIEDNQTGVVNKPEGVYAQAGFFPWVLSKKLPRPLEIAVRWARVDVDRFISPSYGDDRRELTIGANWFFAGHDNKLSADFSRLELEQAGATTLRDYRFRLQWDISF